MKLNKKLILTLTAGVVATSVAVGGIFAWFTSTVSPTDNATFHTAIVKLNLNSSTPSMNAFYPGHPSTITAERELEANITDAAGTGLVTDADQKLFDWWVKYNRVNQTDAPGTNWAFHDDYNGPAPAANDTKVHWLFHPMTDNVYNIFEKVTPATFLYRNYDVTNESNVPVYVRVKKATFTTPGSTGLAQIANMVWMDGTDVPMYPNGDYFYCLRPIFPTDSTEGLNMKNILFHAYFAGNANGNDVQDADIVLLGGADATIEIIQATNNAVYIESTWKDAADAFAAAGTPFVPYAPITSNP